MSRRDVPMLRWLLVLASLAVWLPMAVAVSSCSVAGWGVGSALTRHEPPRQVPAGRALELQPGTRLGVLLADSSLRLGTFAGRDRLEPAVYRARFEAWREQTGIALALGDEVELTWRDGRVTRARFAGFAHRSVLIERDGGPGFVEVRDRDLRWFGLRDSAGWSGEQLADADARGAFPSREAILLRPAPDGAGADWYNTGASERALAERNLARSITLPCDDINAILIEGPRMARTVLFVAGLAVDAVIVVAASPQLAVSANGCAYQGASAVRLQPGVQLTTRDYDTRWGLYDGESGALARGAGVSRAGAGIGAVPAAETAGTSMPGPPPSALLTHP